MADYRQDCPTPGCSYTGFSGHSPGCPVVPFQEQRWQRERERERQEDDAWNSFFQGMTEEELFEYADKALYEWDKAQKYFERRKRAIAYMHKNWLSNKYHDRKRKRNK